MGQWAVSLVVWVCTRRVYGFHTPHEQGNLSFPDIELSDYNVRLERLHNMRSIVTGVAGFIGSQIAERLIDMGHEVIGIDAFVPYYDLSLKRRNLDRLLASPLFRLVEGDLASIDMIPLVQNIDYVFHQAAQAGVRGSWGEQFAQYTRFNVLGTQRLLEALRTVSVRKVVYASSSSVYGNAPRPTHEGLMPQPVSPYGVSKLAAEHLCQLYHSNYGVPTVSLRYFTVYGPRQRPDMAINKFIASILAGQPIPLNGDGRQTRDFTFVSDIVEANLRAAFRPVAGEVMNIGGSHPVEVNEVLEALQSILGRRAIIEHREEQKGDVLHTAADCTLARRLIDYAPSVDLWEGLRRQCEWQTSLRAEGHHAPALLHAPRVRAPRVMLYAHDTFGLGHLRRNLAIATQLTTDHPDMSVLLVSGSPAIDRFPLPPRTDVVRLPAVVKRDNDTYEARSLSLTAQEMVGLRGTLIKSAATRFQPNVVLIDHAPTGMRGELLETLYTLRRSHPQTRTAIGLRDIMDEPAVVQAAWHKDGIYDILAGLYDRLLVYGLPEIFDVAAAYDLPPALASRLHYCGYIRRTDPVLPAAAARALHNLPTEGALVVATVGGGGDGFPALMSTVQALPLMTGAQHVHVALITGPFMAEDDRLSLHAAAALLPAEAPIVHVIEFAPDLFSLLHAADAVVTMGGYNSLNEILAAHAPALVLPRTQPRREQAIRAAAFASLGLVEMLLPEEATPGRIARRLNLLLAESSERRMALAACDHGLNTGLASVSAIVADMLHATDRDMPHYTRPMISVA